MKEIKISIKITLLVITLLLFFIRSNAQVPNDLQHSFDFYHQNHLQEKVFVHTDKDTYLSGEIIWFKIYCLEGNEHQPLSLSKVIYVDILDEHQNPVIQTKVGLKEGIGNGSIYIPVSVKNGSYQFRAYTSWMKNFSSDFYFEKKIAFVNPLRTPERPVVHAAGNIDLQFFPEGGNLVRGLAARIAFKAVGLNGKGVAVTGAVVDARNDTVARFSSLKFGMGNFSFTPLANTSYRAVVSYGGNRITKDLPQINSQGYVMTLVDNGSDQLSITVKSAGITDGAVYLFAHTRQSVKSVQRADMSSGSAQFMLSKSVLAEGISHLTIFDGSKQPVSERLYFRKPLQRLLINANADLHQYGLRQKVSVNIAAGDQTGKKLNADLSMAVYRVDSLQGVDDLNIYTYLWLNSELKGAIESPDYYFNTADKEAAEAVDNLMLTQGWRRFQWENILKHQPAAFSFLPEYRGHTITAKVTNLTSHQPAKDILTYLGIPGKRVQLYTSVSDSSGYLKYDTKDFYGPNEVIVQANSLIDSTCRIDILSPFSAQYSTSALPPFIVHPAMLKALQEHSLGMQVLNIYSLDNIKKFYSPLVDSSAFYGKPTKTYKLDDFTRFTTMEEDLREYVKEDNIVKSKGRFHIKVLTDRGFLVGGDPLVLLDGIPVFDMNKVMTIDPLKVNTLDVVAATYIYGPAKESGIFNFTTYKGDLGGLELDPHATVLDYEGLQLNREFYSPVYDTEEKSSSRIPDFRNLLYWSPDINPQGKDAVSFYTSDLPGKYVGIVQGITANGAAGSQYFNFEVK